MGAQRLKVVKHLPEFGWEAVVLTPAVPGREITFCNVVETEYHGRLPPEFAPHRQMHRAHRGRKISRSLRTWFKRTLVYPDIYFWRWYRPAVSAGLAILAKGNIDVILSTARPFSAHVIGRRLARASGRPWIADFRDLWTQNKHYDRDHGRFYRAFDRQVERWTLRPAQALTTVSPPLADKLRQLHAQPIVRSIPTGYDPEEYFDIPYEPSNRMTITYTGTMRLDCADPVRLFVALRELADEGTLDLNRVQVRFLGKIPDKTRWDVKQFQLTDVVDMSEGWVSHEEAVQAQRQSTVLLHLGWMGPDTGVVTGKLHEYLGARRPILCLGRPGPKDVVQDILEKTQAGVYVTDENELKQALKAYYREFSHKGTVQYRGLSEVIKTYSRIERARDFARLFEEILTNVVVPQRTTNT